MTSDPNDRLEGQSEPDAETPTSEPAAPPAEEGGEAGPPERRKILIGSQRDPDAYRPKPKRDWEPVVDKSPEAQPPATPEAPLAPPAAETPADAAPSPEPSPSEEPADLEMPAEPPAASAPAPETAPPEVAPAPSGKSFPPPNIRGRLSADLEEEFEAALEGVELESLIDEGEAVTKQAAIEPDTRLKGRVVMIRREDVFVELGGREQGIVPTKQFEEAPPEVGAELDVRVIRFSAEDGLYELSLPHSAASVEDWSDLEEGMVIEAKITGHNTGGLECEVNHIRGFIPVSQISLYRVENIEEFVGEKFRCVVTEANPNRRNLVLSRRAFLEREREEAKKALLATLEPGQIHEGTVRKIMDFGAFVELGSGVDGLLHISELGWGRVKHPSDVVSEGQAVKVKIKNYDPATGRIGLAYRDMLPDPWEDVQGKYPPNSEAQGTVTKIMDFGAFVEIEAGVEGLVHISELSHKKIWRVTDVVKEGEQVDVLVQSIDPGSRRISLSMKGLTPVPEGEKKDKKDDEPGEAAQKSKVRRPANAPLKGGLSSDSDGAKFGLKW